MGNPRASTEVKLKVDLPSDDGMIGKQDAIPPTKAFDAADPTTYGMRSSIPMFGANGKPLEAEAYFVKVAGPDATSTDTVYEMHLRIAGETVAPTAPATANRVTFNASGTIASGESLSFGTDGLTIDLGGSLLTEHPFAVQTASHNGEAAGRLTNLELDGAGSVWATYGTNGRQAIGQIVLANFTNPLGLKVQGKATFAATSESGAAVTATPGTAGFGLLRSGALERSNVELTEELVNLISAQRNYQASAKAMETSTSLMQTIMNIRT
jgi:flagellar hook protein FlgE